MNSVLVIFAFFLFVVAKGELTEDQRGKLKSIYVTCEEKSKVDKEQIKLSHEGKKTDDSKLNQYYYCVLTNIGIIDEESNLLSDVLEVDLSENQKKNLEKIVNECKNEKGKDKYETARLLFECYWKTTAVHSVLK